MVPPAKTAPKAKPPAKAKQPAGDSVALAGDPTALSGDPTGVVLDLLRTEATALTAAVIKARLVAGGAAKSDVDTAWRRAQQKLRFHDHVEVARVGEGGRDTTYRWTETPRVISAEEAVFRLSRNPDPGQRERLLAVIQSALEGGAADPTELAEARRKVADAQQRISALEDELAKLRQEATVAAHAGAATAGGAAAPERAESTHEQYERAERRRAARERQARIDAMSTVAELAAEIEELTAKRATFEVLLEHTRALTGGRGLEAIGRAGESTSYDESRHDPVGDFPNEGESVTVIRPGYLWHAPGEPVLISKALVTRA